MPIRPKDPFSGNRAYQRTARKAFPRLVQLARASTVRTYSQFAAEFDLATPRACNYVLGSIAEALSIYGRATGRSVPLLTGVIVNKSTNLPGDGLLEMAVSADQLQAMSLSEKRRLTGIILDPVFRYDNWPDVLRHFGLKESAPLSLPPPIPATGGEGVEHLALKNFVAANPQSIGVARGAASKTEYLLYSGDRVDIVFRWRRRVIAVEIKTRMAGDSELMRGIFQCVKYQAVLEAQRNALASDEQPETLLAIGGRLPANLVELAATLGVRVVQNVAGPGQTAG